MAGQKPETADNRLLLSGLALNHLRQVDILL
jgi:hypothetical protein